MGRTTSSPTSTCPRARTACRCTTARTRTTTRPTSTRRSPAAGKTITYRFNKPFPDFPLAVASLLSFDPYRKDQDQGDKSNFAVFSSGPYKLQGKWNTSKGGTFVRNDQWDAKSDDSRKALPDKIVFTQGLTNEVDHRPSGR